MALTTNTMALSGKALDLLWSRSETILDNIANAETPGYKAKYVNFESELIARAQGGKKASEIGKSIAQTKGRVKTSDKETARLDGNNVQSDVEQAEMARTVLQYQQLAQAYNGEINRLRGVLK